MDCNEDEDENNYAEINKPSYDEMINSFETIRRRLQCEENTPEGIFAALQRCEVVSGVERAFGFEDKTIVKSGRVVGWSERLSPVGAAVQYLVVAKAKVFFAEVMDVEFRDLDDHLLIKEAEEWQGFSAALQSVINKEVDRCILVLKPAPIEINGFSHAFEVAYGADIYLNTRSESAEVSMKLIASKS
ncbi:hypothetical protein NPIL_272891 [Nephila pilipes]|uniref:Uncharacterized protein n=1 Tax=Nephila pilipes TaxID=299642 RepID=A0A8X6R3Y5_NEPPI|nr:hypothetical protein NPIL_272891 [Nephila pilipes]